MFTVGRIITYILIRLSLVVAVVAVVILRTWWPFTKRETCVNVCVRFSSLIRRWRWVERFTNFWVKIRETTKTRHWRCLRSAVPLALCPSMTYPLRHTPSQANTRWTCHHSLSIQGNQNTNALQLCDPKRTGLYLITEEFWLVLTNTQC